MRKKIEFNHAWEVLKWCEENKGSKLWFTNGKESSYLTVKNSILNTFSYDGHKNGIYSDALFNEEYYIEQDWRDTLEDKPVRCLVSNKELDYECIKDIEKFNPNIGLGFGYIDINGIRWDSAQPITKEEAMKYVWGEE